jgi:hypothetical protein
VLEIPVDMGEVKGDVPDGSLETLVNLSGINLVIFVDDPVPQASTGSDLTGEVRREDLEFPQSGK